MLSVVIASLDTLRMFLHVLGATVWVGGQLTVLGLLPALRAAGADVPRAVARRFARVGWPAYALLLATGGWNLADRDGEAGSDHPRTLAVKLVFVALSGLAVWLHSHSRGRRGVAVWGAVGLLASLGALLWGVALEGTTGPTAG